MPPRPNTMTEQQRADQLASYLESVDSGSAFAVPAEFDEPELVELARTARALKTTLQEVPTAPAWVAPSTTQPLKRRRRYVLAWLALPATAIATLVVIINVQSPSTTPSESAAITAAAAIFDDPAVTAVVTDLQNDETFADIDQAIADLESVTEEMEALLDEEALLDIDTALASAEL